MTVTLPHPLRSRRLAAAVTLVGALVLWWSPPAQGDVAVNHVRAFASGPRPTVSTKAELQVKIDQSGPTAHAMNTAVARAVACTGCVAVAAAIQVDLVSGARRAITAVNRAEATSERCVECRSVAAAFQFVVNADGQVGLTSAGHAALRDVHARLARAVSTGGPPEQVLGDVQALADEVAGILASEVTVTATNGRAAPARPSITRFEHRERSRP